MTPVIRAATADDAGEIGRLYAQSAAYLRALGDTTDFQFSAEVYLRDGFGPQPAFYGLVVEHSVGLGGYLLYNFGYDTDRALRYLFVIDLLVDEALRGRGFGRALMNTAARVCREHGGRELAWLVYTKNTAALNFYRKLGAHTDSDLVFMTLPA